LSITALEDTSGRTTGVTVGMPGHAGSTGRVYVYGVTAATGALTTPSAIDPGGLPAATNFGFALASGDLNRDGVEDLVVGAPGSATEMTGRAQVWYRTAPTAFAVGPTLLVSDTTSLSFGAALAIGDYDGNGTNDIAVGGPQLTVGGAANAGRVAMFPEGKPTGTQPLEFQHRTPEAGALFGRSLETLPRSDRPDLLAVGVPGDDVGGMEDAGTVLLY
ncbi:MAG TPA: FG-GAP repeat protein, partial [bacterium]|nr:FG-GAP repeat protein [bacterium]